jgi:hypothetical protein
MTGQTYPTLEQSVIRQLERQFASIERLSAQALPTSALQAAARLHSENINSIMRGLRASSGVSQVQQAVELQRAFAERLAVPTASLLASISELGAKLAKVGITREQLDALDAVTKRASALQPQFRDLAPEVVLQPSVAIAEIIAPDLDAPPDGWAAVPVVAATLSPARRRDLLGRVAGLVLVACFYARALAGSSTDVAAERLLEALLAAWYVYASVLSAIEVAERTLAEDD